MYGINIEDGEKQKCPNCNTVYSIENNEAALYRNITLLQLSKKTNEMHVKCKTCKHMIKINS